MTEMTATDVAADHITMAHAYAAGMGAPQNLVEAESLIKERRPDAPENYAQKIRDAVTVIFMQGELPSGRPSSLGEYRLTARALERDWRKKLMDLNLPQPD